MLEHLNNINLESLSPKEKKAVRAYQQLEALIEDGWEFPNAHTQVVLDFDLDEEGSQFIKELYDVASPH